MNFREIADNRRSCRSYDPSKEIEPEKLDAILESARLAPSACNSQPYRITVCKGNVAKKAIKAVQGMGMNGFASDAPILLVISEEPYGMIAAVGSRIKRNDYRSIDIGILSAYITAEATAQGLGTCILGWVDSEKMAQICEVEGTVRLAITLGYAKDGDKLSEKKRKSMDELVKIIE